MKMDENLEALQETVIVLVAALKKERDQYRDLLDKLRKDKSLWRTSGAGGQDQYAGLPPAIRLIDEVLGKE